MAGRGIVYQTMASWSGDEPLAQDDPEVYDIIRKEKIKQKNGIVLIASEVRSIVVSCVNERSFKAGAKLTMTFRMFTCLSVEVEPCSQVCSVFCLSK